MMANKKLPITEELDFHYLLGMMPPLHSEPEFAWLPELFSIVGYESLITLCKYAGGERIQIPTLSQLSDSIDALDWFNKVHIKQTHSVAEVPANLHTLFQKIYGIYNARNSQASN